MSEFSGHLAKYYDAANNEALAREENTSLRELKWIISELPSRQKFTETLADFWDVAVIAEHKRKSPSEGEIRPGSSVGWTVEQYKKGGAFAVSILTQGTHFGGKIDDLSDARYATDLPILRKDFISSSYQLHEARAFGANAVLLIVAGLSSSRLQDLHEEASSIGLDSLIEVHDEEDLQRALEVGPELIGINNRNLDTLAVDLDTTPNLIDGIPRNICVVAESGYSVKKPEHIRDLRALKVNAVLMGTALMREESPSEALSNWINT